MHRIDNSTAIAVLPAPRAPGEPGFFTGGNPISGTPATVVDEEWLNAQQESPIALMAAAGILPVKGDYTGEKRAVLRLAGGNVTGALTSTALTSDQAGLVVVVASAPLTLTLPDVSKAGGIPLRYEIVRADATDHVVTLQSAAGQYVEGSASRTIAAGERLTVIGDGLSAWYFVGGGLAQLRDMFIGVSFEWNGPNLPAGFLWENGANYSRATYFKLFAAIGTAHGAGDGATTFAVPDSRGLVAIGRDNMGGAAAGRMTVIPGTALGAKGGSEWLQAHAHGVNDPGHVHSSQTRWVDLGTVSGSDARWAGDHWATTTSATTGISIQSVGSGNSQNVQPGIVKNKIIFAGV